MSRRACFCAFFALIVCSYAKPEKIFLAELKSLSFTMCLSQSQRLEIEADQCFQLAILTIRLRQLNKIAARQFLFDQFG